jgi:iron complex outermembrane receptor protein
MTTISHRTLRTRAFILAGVSLLIMASAAGPAFAQQSAAKSMTGAGAEGTDIDELVVTAERDKAAATAPTKASLAETQPESIISRAFIDQVTPETGTWESVALIAPSVSGTAANGGGVGETSKLTLRGFQDGQFNLTYDGIAFGDTNGPTHHAASYWPASTIGAVVIDRGPGAAGDLGQANFGGAIHYFSQTPSDKFGLEQKATYGSFATEASVTTINTGTLGILGGGKLLLNFDERWSAGELSDSSGVAQNQLAKFVLPIGDKVTFTLFGSHNYTRFYQADAGPGETWQQVQTYGKNFALNNNPKDEHYYKYNYEGKATDFDYADLKGQVAPSITAEDQLYTYFYTNKTWAANSISDLVGSNASSLIHVATPPEKATDIGGYDKLNQYRVYGDIVRVNKEWGFGTLKLGGVYEWSGTDRFNELEDFTLGGPGDLGAYPDLNYPKSKYPLLPATTNAKTLENSAYQTWQAFVDFELHPIDRLTITPGFKFVHSEIEVNAADENVAASTPEVINGTTIAVSAFKNSPLIAHNTYTAPLYFGTINYKIRADLSVYGQIATSFLLPGLPNLYYQAANLQSLQPEKTISYQTGVVYSHGNLTGDADVYRVDATNLQASCTVDNQAATCNFGSARYTGVEGEVAYAFNFGATLFANGSLNTAKQLANAANPGAGIATANPAEELTNAPNSTFAIGNIYHSGPWAGTISYKLSGPYVASYNGSQGNRLPGFDTLDASAAYDFGHFKIKLQAFNLLDKRAITTFNGATLYSTKDSGLYEFQAGRQLQATLSAKF